MLDELRVVVTQEAQKDLLSHVIEITGAHGPPGAEELPERSAPEPKASKPVCQALI
jgi:hypothetical protein